MNNSELFERLERIELRLTRMELRQQQILAARQAEEPIITQWLRPKAAAAEWNLSESTLRYYRTRNWSDGSYKWIKGIHWKPRGGYNRAVCDHWFTYRLDHNTHQDFINRWLKAANRLPKNLR